MYLLIYKNYIERWYKWPAQGPTDGQTYDIIIPCEEREVKFLLESGVFVIRTYSLAPMPFTSSSSSDLLLSPSLASAFHGWKILGFG